jgi:cytochrome bd-type quinol oxidase subunit 1
MDIGPNHWIFACVFALVFVVGIISAYKEDIAKNPNLFQGSSKILLGVILFVMIMVVVKILHRLN